MQRNASKTPYRDDLYGALSCLIAVLMATACGSGEAASEHQAEVRHQSVRPDTPEALEEGLELYRRGLAERWVLATDPLERLETIVGSTYVEGLADDGRHDVLFRIGDESFEAERDAVLGFGFRPEPNLPSRPARIQSGERGGLDSGSCRACHFAGGADGAGTLTQVALFRGDGSTLSSAVHRDPPHVMGLGATQVIAREIEEDLRSIEAFAVLDATELGEAVTYSLNAKGVSFGTVTALPDGTIDTSGYEGIDPDLVIRPFGLKGRHATLEAITDEAMALHHGMVSDSRAEVFADRADEFIGNGPEWDPDEDGVEFEASPGQAVVFATYLSMLPPPIVSPPTDPDLALAWARGRQAFKEVGCGNCHVERMYYEAPTTTLRPEGSEDWTVELSLEEEGEFSETVDFGVTTEDGGYLPGVPVLMFTDFKRHDMGPELAEPVAETLPNAEGLAVPGSVWFTRPLWGLADTAPYMHDGRAPTLHDAIELHGGEAEDTRAAYRALSSQEQAELRVFLMSLTRSASLLVE